MPDSVEETVMPVDTEQELAVQTVGHGSVGFAWDEETGHAARIVAFAAAEVVAAVHQMAPLVVPRKSL